jgi:hypothetical protein
VANGEQQAFDSEGYTKVLETLVDRSEKEYYVHLVDINRHQVVVARGLLWLLVVIAGFCIAYIEWSVGKLGDAGAQMLVLVCTTVPAVMALVLSIVAFGFSIFAIPAFGNYQKPYKNSWAEYLNDAYSRWDAGEELVYQKSLNQLLARFDYICSECNKTNGRRGTKLRVASVITIWSTSLIGLSIVVFCFNYYL